MLELNKIYNMDCVEGMKMLPDNYIDLTVTSPPYDNLRTYNGFEWDFETTARELYRVTKQGGVVVWIVGDETLKGSETGTSFKQALFFKECGFNLHDTMIWLKNNPMPRDTRIPRYWQAFEYMFIFSKGKPQHFTFLREPSKTAGETRNFFSRNPDGTQRLDRKEKTKNHTVLETKPRTNVWLMGRVPNSERTKHPAQFSEQLAKDHILSWSNEGDIVLDPFSGSGTTCKVAKELYRNYIGFEISKEYCDIAEQRICQ